MDINGWQDLDTGDSGSTGTLTIQPLQPIENMQIYFFNPNSTFDVQCSS